MVSIRYARLWYFNTAKGISPSIFCSALRWIQITMVRYLSEVLCRGLFSLITLNQEWKVRALLQCFGRNWNHFIQYYSIKTCKLTKYIIWGKNKIIWLFQSQQVQEFKLSVHRNTTKENRLPASEFKLKVKGSTCQKKLKPPMLTYYQTKHPRSKNAGQGQHL